MRVSKGGIQTIVSLAVSAVLFFAAVWLVFNQQYVVDKLAVMQYEPSEGVAALTQRAGLTDEGRFYFYAARPSLDGTTQFNDKCQRQEANSAILGCYVNNTIYIFDVQNDKLDGVEPVTAAHEMLHVVYRRLSESERGRINTLLLAEYEKQADADLKERMEYYERTEPGEKLNELHSIIATEFRNISPELEQYYTRFFRDRQSIVTMHDSYNTQFKELTSRQDTLSTELSALEAEIKKLSDQYNKQVKVLNDDITAFNARAQSGGYASQAEFSSVRTQLVTRSDELDTLRDTVNSKTDIYEEKRLEYNATVNESNKLQESLDSSLAPAPSL